MRSWSISPLACACCAVLAWPGPARAQLTEHPIELGPLAIGYTDTLITAALLRYEQFGYSGPAPIFVDIWHPMSADPGQRSFSWRELRHRNHIGALGRVHDELILRMDSSLIEYDIRLPFDSDDPIDYGSAGPLAVKDALLDLPTHSCRAPIERAARNPVIVYHHGSQGLSDENLWMAEYFASRGYVFLSANFHWPLEQAMYGTPLEWRPDAASVYALIDFARSLTATDSVFYIGHSWGAQEGWCLLDEPGMVQAFVSLETTLEWKTDTVEINDKWPDVHEALRSKSYPMPILMIADTDDGPPFAPFAAVRGEITQVDPLEAFGHECYTSAYLMRTMVNDRFPQPDSTAMKAQLKTYRSMLELLDAWFASVRDERAFPADRFRSEFRIALPR